MLQQHQRLMIIGNGGGGKTTLTYHLASSYDLPLTEIDTLQFQTGWERTAAAELRQAISQVHATKRWLIDGFGPWDQIEERAALADAIIFVDHPIWVHFWWACERQIAAALGQPRPGAQQIAICAMSPNECSRRSGMFMSSCAHRLWH
ncbi:MAG: hypothetical protein Fur005_25960 [Roseiflexaceae bacterium]